MIKMEEKFVKDTTKEDHYIKIAIGFKIIYNQNQYLAYTEMPKKKREVPLDIYIGKVSRLKDKYLLFKCDSESEKNQVFDFFRKLFSGEQIEEIEMMDYSNVERMSIVSFDHFDEKMDQYPNYFELPEKEDDISADIPIPSIFKKKSSKIKATSTEEIQFVGNNHEILTSNVEEHNDLKPVPIEEIAPNNSEMKDEALAQTSEENDTLKQSETETQKENHQEINPAENLVQPEIEKKEEIVHEQITSVPLDPNSVADMNEEIKVTQVVESGKNAVKNKKRSHRIVIALMIITILLIASIIVAYILGLVPGKQEEKKPELPTIQTANLVCTMESESSDFDGMNQSTITMVYDAANKNILKTTENITAIMRDSVAYQERKSEIIIFSQELKNTEGQKYTFKYDDKNNKYHIVIARNYEKATNEEKDETWKTTFEEANEYYLNKGYTCNGKTKEPTVNLTSITGSEVIDYNNWLVTYQKAVLTNDENVLSITLDVQNNGSEKRTLNGEFKLFDRDNKIVKNHPFTKEVEAGASVTVTIAIEKTNDSENINLETAHTYEIELFR